MPARAAQQLVRDKRLKDAKPQCALSALHLHVACACGMLIILHGTAETHPVDKRIKCCLNTGTESLATGNVIWHAFSHCNISLCTTG